MVRFADEGAEHTRAKSKENPAAPRAYQVQNLDWKKATEKNRQPCGLKNTADHTCVLLEVPLKSGVAGATSNRLTMSEGGIANIFVDLETGLILHRRTVETFNNSRTAYQVDQAFTLSRVGIGMPPNAAALFAPPTESKQVKELTRIDASLIDKKMAGKPAPALSVKDINAKPLTLESLKGKVVLLDFWTTWCPPCRADAPSLEKLNKQYGAKDLVIIGISVSEERSVVESYLAKHPRSYPTVLTTENQLPAAYQVRMFPTYIVIERDGNIASASDGDQGFSTLKKLLKKAGLETD
jgi:thiol-disulfide isomerase/thioredoxin